MDIPDATFVVTDTETTGLKAQDHRIIEIGAVKVRNGEVVDRFDQLVNPDRSIPGHITGMTGITTGMVFDAPPIEEVLPNYLDFLEDDILTAHNLSFDKGFLDAEQKGTGGAALSNDTLCTVRLARRLLPGLDSKGLDALVDFYDFDVEDRHRALDDAEATARVLFRLLRRVSFEHDVTTVEGLLTFQHRRYQAVRSVPQHLKRIRSEILPTVPDAPGVYALEDGAGTPLYIGKAKCLSDRLQSHFTAVESKESRRRKLLQTVRGVDWKSTTTELEAILRESRLIKDHKPRYNRAQRRAYRRPFLRLDTDHRFPTISWTRTLANDGAEYFGPVRNKDRAEMVVDVTGRFFRLRECDDARLHLGQRCLYADMDRCTVPCENEDEEAYAKEVRRVRAFLTGQDPSVVQQLRRRMERASEELDFEKAAEIRDRVGALEQILERQRVLAAPVRRRSAAVLHEHGEGTVDVLFVRFGQYAGAVSLSGPPTSGWHGELLQACQRYFDRTEEPPETMARQVTNEIRLLSHWLRSHRDELRVVPWIADRSPHRMVEIIQAALTTPVLE